MTAPLACTTKTFWLSRSSRRTVTSRGGNCAMAGRAQHSSRHNMSRSIMEPDYGKLSSEASVWWAHSAHPTWADNVGWALCAHHAFSTHKAQIANGELAQFI